MAQILKESVKNQIIEAAIDDLYLFGYKNSSLRRIAAKANMTASNLYRYFESKDQLIEFITKPVMDRINDIIQKNTNISINLIDKNVDIRSMTLEGILSALDALSYELVDIYEKYPKILVIMMRNNALHEQILEWLSGLITQFMSVKNSISHKNIKKYELLARIFSVSLFSGIEECLTRNELSKEEMSQVIKVYFYSCIAMLDKDFSELEG